MGAAHGTRRICQSWPQSPSRDDLILYCYPLETAVLVARGARGSSRRAAGLELDCGTLQRSN